MDSVDYHTKGIEFDALKIYSTNSLSISFNR